MKIERFEDLKIWQEARSLSKYVFGLTLREPFCKDFKLKRPDQDIFRINYG